MTVQLSFLESVNFRGRQAKDEDLGLTFRDSKTLPIHRWYPYVEGFAADYISSLFRDLPTDGARVYDPFGGSGTVCVIASNLGYDSAFSELNPYMRFVAETKVNAARWAKRNKRVVEDCLARFLDMLNSPKFEQLAAKIDLVDYERAFPGRDFFEDQDIRELIAAKYLALEAGQSTDQMKCLLLLAISSLLVHNSNMTRRADLRRRKEGEYKNRIVDVRHSIRDKLRDVAMDLRTIKSNSAKTSFVNEDSREFVPTHAASFDKIITSPPYLNGTNYFRNTKIELWFLGYLSSETELSSFNDRCVSGGINNVSGRRSDARAFDAVEDVVEKLDRTDGDKRIGKMVRHYFNDMRRVLENCRRYLKPGALLHLDIGDSKFYGVHVPTDKLLAEVAADAKLRLVEAKLLARRHSRDKTPLTQVELTFAARSR